MDARDEPNARLDYSKRLGFELQRRRRDLGLTQEGVAHIAGITTFTYLNLEKGASKPGTPGNPRMYTLIALAQALGTTVAELLPTDPPDVASGR